MLVWPDRRRRLIAALRSAAFPAGVQRIGGDDAAGDVETGQQFTQLGDLAGLVADVDPADDETTFMPPTISARNHIHALIAVSRASASSHCRATMPESFRLAQGGSVGYSWDVRIKFPSAGRRGRYSGVRHRDLSAL
jgi:hypothetical protein